MKKKFLAVAILIVSMLAVGCSNTQDLGMSFEEFKEKYNENVRREGLPSEYLIRRDNILHLRMNEDVSIIDCNFPDFMLTIWTNSKSNRIISVEVRNRRDTNPDFLKLSYMFPFVAMLFDSKWESLEYAETQIPKICKEGKVYKNGDYLFYYEEGIKNTDGYEVKSFNISSSFFYNTYTKKSK